MSTEARVRLAFSGLNPLRQQVMQREVGGPEALVAAIHGDRVDVPHPVWEAVRVDAGRRLAWLEERDIKLVFRGETAFPAVLEGLPDCPEHLFVRGAVPARSKAVAVVGTRRATAYGLRVAEHLGRLLGGCGVAVVSGLAKGIDGAAHRGTLAASGTGWAVLGSGVDRWYPARHAGLGEELIAGGGSVLSEYPPGTEPAPWRFPIRNRIIAGLACAVVVVEAAVKGGALITARLALDQGREVFAVPGDIDREVSEGCNRLIADGAIPVVSFDELFDGLGFLHAADPSQPSIPDLEVLGPLGATPDEIGIRLGLDPTATRVQIGRWEALGLARRRGEVVERVTPS